VVIIVYNEVDRAVAAASVVVAVVAVAAVVVAAVAVVVAAVAVAVAVVVVVRSLVPAFFVVSKKKKERDQTQGKKHRAGFTFAVR
jgi:Flp pilus assembly protein TadB